MSDIEQAEHELKAIEDEILSDKKSQAEAEQLARNLSKKIAKNRQQLTSLKRHVWQSVDPEIVNLRNELLMVVKLTWDGGK